MEKVIDWWRRFVTVLHASNLEELRQNIEDLGVYDLHNILQQRKKVEWCEWHLNINVNDKAIQIAEQFHQDFKKLKLSSSIIDQVQTIEETFLKFMPENDNWNEIRNYFEQAREQDNPLFIITAYTTSKELSGRLNTHSAVNTYHALKFYCTLLNCPILARTQEYTEAFTKILFHPKLNPYLVRQGTFYRGIILKDKKLVENYKEGATIITTTFLSTSEDPAIANMFSDTGSNTADSFSSNYPNAPDSLSGGDSNISDHFNGRDFNVSDRFSGRDFNVFDRFNRRDFNVSDRFSGRDFNASDRFNGRDFNLTNRYSSVDTDATNYCSGVDPNVSDSSSGTILKNAISIYCTYNINNTNRRTALNITNLSKFETEKEILILRYIPFKITSIERTDDGRRMKICFDECKEEFTEEGAYY